MKNIFLLMIVLGFSLNLKSQIIHTVTTSTMGVLDASLDDAISQANIEANSGYDVIIYLNVPDIGGDGVELIPISSSLVLNNTDGSILITKYIATTVTQGLDGTGMTEDNAKGLSIIDAKDITIKGLNFENFQKYYATPQRSINIETSFNIVVENNVFINNDRGVQVSESIANIHGNEFLNHETDAVTYKEYSLFGDSFIGVVANVYINNNIIHYSDGFVFDEGNYDGIVCCFYNPNTNLNFYIEDNIISCRNQCIQIFNEREIGQSVDLVIESNSLSNSYGGIVLNAPRAHWVVENNIISTCVFGIILGRSETGLESDHGIDFINPNTHGFTPINTGNSIVDCEISFSSDLIVNNHIVGYNVEGRISVEANTPTTIRDVLIDYPGSPDNLPIYMHTSLDPLESVLTIASADYLDANLTIITNIALIGLIPENGPYTLEFYEANAHGELISYLGKEEGLTMSEISHTTVFTDVFLTEAVQIGVTITSTGTTSLGTSEVAYAIGEIDSEPCDDCVSFKPIIGESYWLSAWVQVEEPFQVKTYKNEIDGVSLELGYFGSGTASSIFYPTGEIIDGWQRIVGKFIMPSGTIDLLVVLNSDNTYDTYFDDIRIHPFNGSMKSYVYDGETFWLTSELDDNNYATFYEYDEEGGLIRIKKETSRGIVTIQETKSNTQKDE